MGAGKSVVWDEISLVYLVHVSYNREIQDWYGKTEHQRLRESLCRNGLDPIPNPAPASTTSWAGFNRRSIRVSAYFCLTYTYVVISFIKTSNACLLRYFCIC